MGVLKSPLSTALLLLAWQAASAQNLPVLDWVKQIGSSGQVAAVASATDRQGNLYLAGNTSSLEFPVISATQPQPGGSPLALLDSGSGSLHPLFDPLLTNATKFAVDPGNSSTLYAAAGTTLVSSTDSGANWAAIDGLPAVSLITSITVDPSDSSIIYVTANTQGLFRSGDGGMTWVALTPNIPPPASNTIFYVSQLWVDRGSSAVLFASSGAGLIRSSDSGASWTVVLPGDITFSLAFDPFMAGTIYHAGAGKSGTGVKKSTDDGLTWRLLADPANGFPSQVVADPFHAGVLYAGAYFGLFESKDGGLTWTAKTRQQVSAIAADPSQPVLYASLASVGVVRSTDGFTTYQTVSATGSLTTQILVAGAQLFVATSPSADLFIVKLDPQGRTVYSTYFGGSGSDNVTGIAAGSDGSLYVTGVTASFDFPITPGAYLSTPPATNTQSGNNRNFVFKLNPDGSLAWSTYFADAGTSSLAIAVDGQGSPYTTGATFGKLPVTEGAYERIFQNPLGCGPGNIGPCPFPISEAFLNKFSPDGAALVFSTYISRDKRNAALVKGAAIVLDSSGNAYIGGDGAVFLMSSDGSALLASNVQRTTQVNAIALDAVNNLYATGQTSFFAGAALPTTPGAFQSGQQPPIPALPGIGLQPDAFVIKLDSTLSEILASTLLGGEGTDTGRSIAIDSAGNIAVGGVTTSKAFPTRAPLQASFSDYSGFFAILDPTLSTLLFSTYIGDAREFAVQSVTPDGSGNIFLFGSTLVPGSSFCLPTPCNLSAGSAAFANKFTLTTAPGLRLDAVVNSASQYAQPLSPGESIDAIGSGFDANTQVLLNGAPLPIQARGVGRLTALVPADLPAPGVAQISVGLSSSRSNPIVLPTSAASPGIYSVAGNGVGQGYILNSDGSLNSPDNPAAVGSAITIFTTGTGAFRLDGPYAVTAQMISIYIDGFYADGISANVRTAAGLPGKVYAISVYIPDPSKFADLNPNLLNFKMPPQVPVLMVVGPVLAANPAYSATHSQSGLALSVKTQ